MKQLAEPTCMNCAYYIQHLMITRKKELRAINCGHCAYSSVRSLHKSPSSVACKHFEFSENKIEKSRNDAFRDVVKDMHIKLEELLAILSSSNT